ncbi:MULTISPECIES: beta-carotene 15,15'-monooxygenase [unclassified Kaistella]|uniref:beta-carotene 15,15'-monooxygenase n=1 Tax=unclassified Kaistella TaxID=2762626 RepID=UPI00273754C3|nr:MULTISPECIES: beta-carotene 15,15'-monooxygenase [unclassified Kaistella]MDP2453694.1 beta-carotene 15,15'-monooxygenase [Kaistella sp. SH11-4b]MDP2456751.1 beta-carotene 15,15'-monooxygenase [Kaistella sp. SH40-3]MDP2459507.1 beta-carotene 15,15'-monooxygenase [Kaistella sp. SH19-2b]
MPEFDLDSFKETWQKQPIEPKYDSREIESMLNKSSRNYVKYILWISLVEFILILGANLYYLFLGEDTTDLMSVLGKLGIDNSSNFESTLSNIYLILKIVSLVMTAVFVYCFYQNYRKINVESNLKKLILQIIKFKKTVQLFIVANIALVILFTLILGIFTFSVLAEQNIELTNPTLIGFIAGLLLTMGISVVLIWIYYRVVYGFILRRLGKNLEQLQNIEEGN